MLRNCYHTTRIMYIYIYMDVFANVKDDPPYSMFNDVSLRKRAIERNSLGLKCLRLWDFPINQHSESNKDVAFGHILVT